MSSNEMAYYEPVSAERIAAWDEYRKQYQAWFRAASELSKSVGATRWCKGFGGFIVGCEFGNNKRHPAFSAKTLRGNRSAHGLLTRGKTQEEKDAVAWMTAENAKLAAMLPSASKIGEEHGFVSTLQYVSADGEATGFRHIGYVWDTVQATWFDSKAPVIIFAPDVAAAIAADTAEGKITQPASWSVPEGYVRLTAAEFRFREAEHDLRKERAKAGAEE